MQRSDASSHDDTRLPHCTSRLHRQLDQVAEFTPKFAQGSTRAGACLSEERADPEAGPDWLEGTSIEATSVAYKMKKSPAGLPLKMSG